MREGDAQSLSKGWKYATIRDVENGFYDGPHATPKESENGGIFLGIKNIDENGKLDLTNIRYISNEDMPKWTKRVIPKHKDIVFSYEATLHRYAIIPKGFHGCLGRRMALLRVNENADYRFIYYYMLAPIWRKEIEGKILNGATVDRIPISNFLDFKIQLPPLDTQRKIANILSGYDDLIENNLKRIKILEEMAQQTYEEWFVRMRFPGYETEVFDENGLPEGWEKVKLGEACNLVMGQSPKSEDYNVDGNGLPFHQGVKDYGYRFPLNKSWSISGNKKAIPNSILFSVRAPVGRLNVASEEIILGRGLAAINDKNGLNSFLYYQLRTIFFEDNLIGGGAIYASVTKNDIERIELIYANELGGRFNDYASKIDKEILNLTNQNQRLREARDILLPRLMMGMIDVSGSLVQVESLQAKPTDAKVIPLEQPKKEASKEFKEAVLIACLTERFGSEKFPLGRKRYTKLSYLFHRYSDNKIQDYLRKAAGPYNPKTKYGGPEKIALQNKYIQNWKGEKGTKGFVSAEKIEDAKTYFSNYWKIADLDWLTTAFKFKSNDELELLATVDNSLVELSKKNLDFTAANVLNIIKSEKEWEAKLERTIFSDANVERAIGFLRGVLEYNN
ncbi:type I restriction enzyme S subunit [Chryseobacterium ginsenosidimutans]|uniref:restriction endonuclease subunit S n=1 Tax=Chryseobacterium ginsenosidimutans TaxID=687846 RepID=UPI002782A249|nr:restriction endonuclease subunit S [Chryseobacterium ginsenosidimutans]MDQ0593937.1 type I restriction enzyme S subunit [Chryseobacterium ginsenosidimutans]